MRSNSTYRNPGTFKRGQIRAAAEQISEAFGELAGSAGCETPQEYADFYRRVLSLVSSTIKEDIEDMLATPTD